MKEDKAVAKLGEGESFSLVPKTLDEAMKFSEIISKTDMVPKDFIGKPGNILVAIQMGLEIGLPPLQALQNIAVINGRPCLYGDSALALVKIHPRCEYVHEYYLDKKGEKTIGDDYQTAVCVVKRRGQGEEKRTFSLEDAKKAKLLVKVGPWSAYPKRMLGMRARGFALRDVFPDALKGLSIAEEARDIPQAPKDVTPKETVVESPYEVPEIDRTVEVMVSKEAAAEPQGEETQQGSVAADKVTPLLAAIDELAHSRHADNWLTKHSTEISALSNNETSVVMGAFKVKREELAADEHTEEETSADNEETLADGFKDKIEAAEDLPALDVLFDEAQGKIKTGKLIVQLKRARDKKAQELKA